MATKPTVLVVGSTGMLGTKIVFALLDKGTTHVKAMVRPNSDGDTKNREKNEAMKARGATLVEGDLMKPETLLQVCEGVNYVPQQYEYTMVSGLGKLDNIQNDRYPNIKPVTVKEYLQQMQTRSSQP